MGKEIMNNKPTWEIDAKKDIVNIVNDLIVIIDNIEDFNIKWDFFKDIRLKNNKTFMETLKLLNEKVGK